MFPKDLLTKVELILTKYRESDLRIAFAESCTGGLLSALFTEIAGSSDVFERGFVTYSNQAKMDLLGVKKQTLEKFGAVSRETAEEMANGVIKNSQADIAISVTGIAGPGGGSEEKPVGLVYIGFVRKGEEVMVKKLNLDGNRSEVRMSVLREVLGLL